MQDERLLTLCKTVMISRHKYSNSAVFRRDNRFIKHINCAPYYSQVFELLYNVPFRIGENLTLHTTWIRRTSCNVRKCGLPITTPNLPKTSWESTASSTFPEANHETQERKRRACAEICAPQRFNHFRRNEINRKASRHRGWKVSQEHFLFLLLPRPIFLNLMQNLLAAYHNLQDRFIRLRGPNNAKVLSFFFLQSNALKITASSPKQDQNVSKTYLITMHTFTHDANERKL